MDHMKLAVTEKVLAFALLPSCLKIKISFVVVTFIVSYFVVGKKKQNKKTPQ